jgi:hypothetical protein
MGCSFDERQIASRAKRFNGRFFQQDSHGKQSSLVKTLPIRLATIRCRVCVEVTGVGVYGLQQI